MADLITDPANACCSPAAQTSCCAPSEKAACCDASAAGGTCGCSAGTEPDIRETVRERYAQAARAASAGQGSACGCGPISTADATGAQVFGSVLYADEQAEGATATAVQASRS